MIPPRGNSQHGYAAAVATPHGLATQAAMAIISSGGNAIDGAIAANAVLGVVAPETCGIGGDLFALVHLPGMERPDVLNASGRAGSGADPEKLRRQGHRTMPAFDPQTVTVPGCVDGWEALLGRYGSRELGEILAPAIGLATNGFPASTELVGALTRRPELAQQGAGEVLYRQGQPPGIGDRIRRPDLAATLETVARGGREGFYLGPSGDGIVQATGGVITLHDLEQVQAEWTDPVGRELFGLTGWVVPPNSQGYLTLGAGALFELLDPPHDPEDPRSWHLAIEAYRSMAADRNELVADPDFAPVAPEDLVSDERIARRAAGVDPDRAGEFSPPSTLPGGTAYLAVVDADGLAVSFIQSNFMGIGAGLGAGDAGFFLHNRGAGFDLRPGHPNELAAGKRPLHTLAPSLWTRDGKLACLLGTRGGDYQPQLLLQVALRCLWAGMEEAEAQAMPRWMVEPIDADRPVVAIEAHTPQPTIDHLTRMGHTVSIRPDIQHGWGPVSLITIDDHGKRTAAADPSGHRHRRNQLMSLLLVIRHGRAQGNSEHRFIGQTDVALDEIGRSQAQALADRLKLTPIDRIVSSDLQRAVHTITPLAQATGLPIALDPRLREISNGEWSGLLPAEIAAGWPDLWAAYRKGEDVRRPGGEQWESVRERVVTAAREHAGSGEVVVLCTHGGPGLNLARWAIGLPAGGNIFMGRLGTLDNTSVTTIEVDDESPDLVRLVGFNDVGHLAGATLDLRSPLDPVV